MATMAFATANPDSILLTVTPGTNYSCAFGIASAGAEAMDLGTANYGGAAAASLKIATGSNDGSVTCDLEVQASNADPGGALTDWTITTDGNEGVSLYSLVVDFTTTDGADPTPTTDTDTQNDTTNGEDLAVSSCLALWASVTAPTSGDAGTFSITLSIWATPVD